MEEIRDAKGLTEKEFIEIYKTKNYPRPYLTADILVFGKDNDDIYILLVKRKGHPFIGKWATPGGFAQSDETIEQTALRELQEETCLTGLSIAPVGIFSKPQRDPRGWVVSMAYYGVVEKALCRPIAADDAADCKWFKVIKKEDGLQLISEDGSVGVEIDSQGRQDQEILAFDHSEIILLGTKLL